MCDVQMGIQGQGSASHLWGCIKAEFILCTWSKGERKSP